ncbi:MAG: hypothetical protein J6X80_09000 [Lachnospiraceae bacterium]|nr:hypothetical protein [Lachnospiraceae bacterium]
MDNNNLNNEQNVSLNVNNQIDTEENVNTILSVDEAEIKKQKKSYYASLLWKLTLTIVIILFLQLIFVGLRIPHVRRGVP